MHQFIQTPTAAFFRMSTEIFRSVLFLIMQCVFHSSLGWFLKGVTILSPLLSGIIFVDWYIMFV